MSTASAAHGDAAGHHEEEHIHPPSFYIKTWAVLLVLLAISIAGPMLEIRAITLITAFGIAVVKAYIVCSRFMHLNVQKKYVVYFLITSIAFMFLFFFAIAPDVLKHHGTNWVNTAAIAEIERHGGHDGGADVHEGGHDAKGGHEAKAEGGDTGESPEVAARHEAALKKLEGVEAAMKTVASELKAPPPAPAPVEPDPTTPPPAPAPAKP